MAPPRVPEGCPLTYRQFITLRALAEGLTQQQAADLLGIAWSTLRSRTNAAFRALGCANANQAISIMGRKGWIDWEPAEDATPLAVERPFLAAYLQHFGDRWPAEEPDVRARAAMDLALAGNRLHPNPRKDPT